VFFPTVADGGVIRATREKIMRLVRGEPDHVDQVPRREAYEAAHPDVKISYHGPHWQAVIPERAGETVITRYSLKALLDKLDELAAS
jgi:hypothetical protein